MGIWLRCLALVPATALMTLAPHAAFAQATTADTGASTSGAPSLVQTTPLGQLLNELTGQGTGGPISPLALCINLALGGILSLLIRQLYRRCSVAASNSDSISRVFPLLTIITTAVIAIVKSSLSLSLGLVGALSIVRFRAAIKEPEELVYLFLCIAVGLALGASQALLAMGLVLVAAIFAAGMHWAGRSKVEQSLFLTITGDADRYFREGQEEVFGVVKDVVGRFTLQRYDVESGRGQVRLVLPPADQSEMSQMMTALRDRLPDCEMSYVNLNSPL